MNGFFGDEFSGMFDVDLNFDFLIVLLDDYVFEDGCMVGYFCWFDWDWGVVGVELLIVYFLMCKGEGMFFVDGMMSFGGWFVMDVVVDCIMFS